MTRYHINPDTGKPGACGAQSGNCPFGGEHQHFASEANARAAYELSMAAETLPPSPAKVRGAYPDKGDRVLIKAGARAFNSAFAAYEGQEGEVETFGGTTYSVRFSKGELVHGFNFQVVDFTPEPEVTYDISPTPKPERKYSLYPEAGDDVKIVGPVGAMDSKLTPYENQSGVVEEFTGTYYHVRFPDGTVQEIHHQAVVHSIAKRNDPPKPGWPMMPQYRADLRAMSDEDLLAEQARVESARLPLSKKVGYVAASAAAVRERGLS